MNHRWLLPGLSALVFLIVACVPTPQIRNDNLLHDTSLITGEPCQAPCWNNIVPGETSWRDAQTIIEDNTAFTNFDVQTDSNSDTIQLAWQEGDDGDVCCVIASDSGDTVDRILLQFAPEMTMGDIIDAIGEPNYVTASDVSADQAVMILIYEDLSTVVYAFVAGAETGVLSESSEIVGALYLKPEDAALLLQTSFLHEWEGLQPYSVYTPDEDVAEFEITPSVTLTPTPDDN
ncbi:MAG: hypothetical protein D6737_03415 [Chloroflexi bacterium]|nr:MAG: hypothetical protein CUN54_07435 [Phototrophicales bacterium]RMF81931.1 MAG: hypothetical protein D6737_03415 [Chloroflexota bacterium]